MDKAKLPLEGFRVLEVAHFQQGPVAGHILADLGAEVIKIEDSGGDHLRAFQNMFGRSIALPDGKMLLFEVTNRNKKSVTLNLRKPQAKEVIYRLAKTCDVFLTNMTSGALRGFELDEDSIRKHNAEIIYAAGNLMGSKGPDAALKGLDTTGLARSGIMMTLSKDGEPLNPSLSLSDLTSGTMLAFGIVTALLGREKHGVVQAVEASQLGSLMWLQRIAIEFNANMGKEFAKPDRKSGTSPLMTSYKCQDGRWLAITISRPDRYWAPFCLAMGVGHCIDDPRFATVEARWENGHTLVEIFDAVFATKPREEWAKLFREKGFWFSIVNTIPDLVDDPQVIANEYIATYENGLKMVALPFQMSKCEPLRGKTPELGADTVDVLLESGCCTPEELAQLVAEGVV